MQTEIATASVPKTRANKYRSVNGAWPENTPKPTPEEALRGAKRILKEAYRYYEDFPSKPLLTYSCRLPNQSTLWTWKLTSGNRHTWARARTWSINPNYAHRPGWPGIVHSMSHWIHQRVFPHKNPHDPAHAMLEHHLIDYVVYANFFPKRTQKEKPPVDVHAERKTLLLARMKRWESKRKRAETALKKLKRKLAYYQKRAT